jgi:hypothetical protein
MWTRPTTRRVKAVEFALEHDDGLGSGDTLHEADVVLVGVSRTSKTPTCMYLAQQGYKAANVSLGRVWSRRRSSWRCRRGRSRPWRSTRGSSRRSGPGGRPHGRWRTTSYNLPGAVAAEVAWSRRLFARAGWAVFDVTDQAIEETAARVVDRLGLNVKRMMQKAAAVDGRAPGINLLPFGLSAFILLFCLCLGRFA